MAGKLQTPSILPIVPFDPVNAYNIEFVYQDSQPVKNRAVIIDNETGITVYDETVEIIALLHPLPVNTLTAGKKYSVQIQVFDSANNTSDWSESVLFTCLTTPEFKFENLENDSVYKQANITLQLKYYQKENEQLRNYQIIQYDAEKVEIASSDVIYKKENLTYTFYGLENNNTYYFRAIGETQNGMPLDTGYIGINVELVTLPIDAVFELENDYLNGVVRLLFNIKDVHYELSGDEDYTFSNGMVTLNNTSLIYNEGFEATDDFTLFCQANKVSLGTFLDMENGAIQLSTLKICDSYYCELKIKDSDFRQYVTLEGATITDDGQLLLTSNNTYVTFIIKRLSGYYGLELV